MRRTAALLFAGFGLATAACANDLVFYPSGPPRVWHPGFAKSPPCEALSARDAVSGMTFVVGSDGRYIQASDAGGNRLWNRDPYAEKHFTEFMYRSPCLAVLRMNPREAGRLDIQYNQGQHAILDAATGDVTYQARD